MSQELRGSQAFLRWACENFLYVFKGRSLLQAVGLDNDNDFDLWTALVAGLASQ